MMKKFMLVLILSFIVCEGVMAADNGEILTKEESHVQTFMAALHTTEGYEAAKESMSDTLTAAISAQKFISLQKQIQTTFGMQREMKLALVEKFDQGDRLTYVAVYGNNQLVRIVVTFGLNGKQGIQRISFTPIRQDNASHT